MPYLDPMGIVKLWKGSSTPAHVGENLTIRFPPSIREPGGLQGRSFRKGKVMLVVSSQKIARYKG